MNAGPTSQTRPPLHGASDRVRVGQWGKRLEEDEAGVEVRGAPERRRGIRGTIQAQQQGKRVPTADLYQSPMLHPLAPWRVAGRNRNGQRIRRVCCGILYQSPIRA